ncbi:MAG: tRNA (adenosine(37)-N6)-dimethylallyltransferase MiaA [Anaerolineales bacterium]|nr:tRNA (adenosine(37)-N6)-dimethylallyltransferase MiaA [Anaerolineales bacterium]
MLSETKLPPLIVILGPTAAGKTALSISLAGCFNGEIISADSRLFYRGMDIGTAKPTADEMAFVRHHLIDVADPDDEWSLGRFKRAAGEVIEDIHQRAKVPFLVGGTGQFVRAITEGWIVPELTADERLREVLNRWADEIGAEGLYQRLQVVDPAAAENILPGNLRRSVRAFEVIFKTGVRFSALRRRGPVPYRVLQIGLNRPRPELDRRIGERVDQMIAAGFVEEVARLLEQGISPELSSMSAIGYRQIVEYLNGKCSLEEAVEEIKKITRKFYRRQMTWFKITDPEIHWFEMGETTLAEISVLIEGFLSP